MSKGSRVSEPKALDPEVRRVKKMAEDWGWRITRTKSGWRLLAPDGVHTDALHMTYSDWRWVRNHEAVIRLWGIDPVVAAAEAAVAAAEAAEAEAADALQAELEAVAKQAVVVPPVSEPTPAPVLVAPRIGRVSKEVQNHNEAILYAALLHFGNIDGPNPKQQLLATAQQFGGYWRTPSALTTYLAQMKKSRAVSLTYKGKRLAGIALVNIPTRQHAAVEALIADGPKEVPAGGTVPPPYLERTLLMRAAAAKESTEPTEPTEQPELGLAPEVDADFDYRVLSEEMLRQVCEILARPDQSAALTEQLRQALDDRAALRTSLVNVERQLKQARERGDTLQGELRRVRAELDQHGVNGKVDNSLATEAARAVAAVAKRK